MQIESLNTPEEVTAAARSRLYRLLADGFVYPDRELFAVLLEGGYRDEVAETCRSLPYELETDLAGLLASGDYIEFQSQYLSLFEAAMGMPPCPLYSGLYRGGRKSVMEELTRFYNYFGLSIEHGGGELPDHITTEMEFMHYLTFKELAALHGGKDEMPYRRAQADFLERQLVSWLPALESRLHGIEPEIFYMTVVQLATAFARTDLAALVQTVDRDVEAAVEA